MASVTEQDTHQKMQTGLEKAIGPETSRLIAEILEKINQLSDVGKLLLYLKLPTGAAAFQQTPLRSDKESGGSAIVLNWIKTHVEENSSTCLPKQDVYENYRTFAERHKFACVSMADFGKLLKTVCPNIRDRRLGKRGNTKYVHSGIQYITDSRPFTAPDIVVPSDVNNKSHSNGIDGGGDIGGAAGTLVLEWARKLFEREFVSITQLAEHLITSGFVSSRSLEAFSIIAAASSRAGGTALGLLPAVGQDATSTSSTHAQLRKNIQEREALGRLKIKLEEQKIQLSAVAVRPVDRHPTELSSKESTDQRDASIVSTLAASSVKLPARKSTVVTATPPKRILPKMAPAVAGECVPTAMSNHTVVAAPSAAPGANGSAAHYVLLSPNPTHAQHQMFIIPPPVHQVDKPSAIPAPPNVGAISLMPQPPIVSQLPVTTSVHQSVAKPIILSPLVTADALRAAASIPFVDASSNTIRSISFVDSSGGEVGPSRVDARAAVAAAAESSRLLGANIASLSRHQGGPATEVVLDEVASRGRAAVGIGRSAVVDVRELKMGASGAGEVMASEAYSNVSSLIDVLVNQGCLNTTETRSAAAEVLTVAGANATSNSNQTLPLFSSSVVTIPVCSAASSELVGGQNAAVSGMLRTKVVPKQKAPSSSKTVMSLLRESQSEGSGDHKSYMKDSRPVARILKEERERKQATSTMDAGSATAALASWSSSLEGIHLTSQCKEDLNSVHNELESSYAGKKLPASSSSAAPCSLLKELLTSRPSTGYRRPSIDRPSSVTDVSLSAMLPQLLSPSLETVEIANFRVSRKRPHTALDDPLSSSGIWSEGLGADRSSSVDFIEKGAAQDDMLMLDDVIQSLLSAAPANKVVQPAAGVTANDAGGSTIDFNMSFSHDVEKSSEPPLKKLSFINRSVENLTLQQLQQARDISSRTATDASLRAQSERWRHLSDGGEQCHVLTMIGVRPLSAFGEPIASSDTGSMRDSRPNTVAAIWEPTTYRGCSSSADSCDSGGPLQSTLSQEPPFFTPIQVQSEDLQASVSCDLVKPLAKIAVSHTNGEVTGIIDGEMAAKQCHFPSGVAASSSVCAQDLLLPGSSGGASRGRIKRGNGIRVWQRYAEHVVAPDDGQPKLTGSLLSPFLRSETPLSTEVSSIIAAGDRMIPSCSAAAESGHAADDATTSPHRSQSVPVGLLFDLDDISAEFTNDPCFDVFDGKSEPSYSDLDDFNLQLRRPSMRRAAAPENRAGFWDTLPRGDHLISGTSFCPEQCAIGDTSSSMIARVTAGCRGVVASTPPHSQNPSPSFVDAGYHQMSRPPTVCATVIGIETPTSLEQVPAANDNLVDELFSNNAQLTGASAVGYEWEDDVVSVGRLIGD